MSKPSFAMYLKPLRDILDLACKSRGRKGSTKTGHYWYRQSPANDCQEHIGRIKLSLL